MKLDDESVEEWNGRGKVKGADNAEFEGWPGRKIKKKNKNGEMGGLQRLPR